MAEIVIYWKTPEDSTLRNTLISTRSIEEGLKKFLMMKGGTDKVIITSFFEYDRVNEVPKKDTAVHAADRDGLIYKLYH